MTNKRRASKRIIFMFVSATFISILWTLLLQQQQQQTRVSVYQNHLKDLPIIIPMQMSPANLSATTTDLSRPPLSALVRNNKWIGGNVSFLLDFGILGFGKCGTSTMMHWLAEHPEIRAFKQEKFELVERKLGLFVRQLYEELPDDGNYKRGYKSPRDIRYRHVLDYYRIHFVNAKIILGIRHPVTWFQSLYNYRVQNMMHGRRMPEPSTLIGNCVRGMAQTCTNNGDFAFGLMGLGKTNHPHPREPTEMEKTILSRHRPFVNLTNIPYVPNPVFLFDLTQLGDANTTRTLQFRKDLSEFLGLKQFLPKIPRVLPGKQQHQDQEEQKRRESMKIDICHEQHRIVRDELMILARSSSWWIRKIFLNSSTVFVSSREYFEEILESWMKDPCDDGKRSHGVNPTANA